MPDNGDRKPPGGSDNEWIVAALERHEKPLLRYVAWLLDDADSARDIVQEGFLRLCKETPESVGKHLPQWLFAVCRNLAVDLRRARVRRDALTRAAAFDERDVAVAIESMEQRALIDEVMRIAEALPKPQREVVYLRFQCGFTYKEVSALTSLSVGHVGFLIHSALQEIRRRIDIRNPMSPARKSHGV